jgi:hypothetical protein
MTNNLTEKLHELNSCFIELSEELEKNQNQEKLEIIDQKNQKKIRFFLNHGLEEHFVYNELKKNSKHLIELLDGDE